MKDILQEVWVCVEWEIIKIFNVLVIMGVAKFEVRPICLANVWITF